MGHLPDDPPNEMLFHIIPFEYASEIAYVISNWARLEYEIDGTIWSLAGLDDTPKIGACLTAQYSTANHRFNALISLARIRGVPDFEIGKLNKFKERAMALGERRNRVAHDPWLTSWDPRNAKSGPGQTYRLQKTARAKLDYDYKPIALEELKALKADIEAAIQEFNDLPFNPTIEVYKTR